MAAPVTFTGARAILQINGIPVGSFDSFNWGVTLDVTPIAILGRYTAAESVYTGYEPVRCSGSGWRVINSVGLQGQVSFPTVQALMTAEYITISVLDRVSNNTIATISEVRPETYSTGVAARQASQVSYSFMGLVADDEVTANAEGGGAGPVGTLPSGS